MPDGNIPWNELCHFESGRSLAVSWSMPYQPGGTKSSNVPPPGEGRWLAWGRSAFAVAIVLVLIALGIANIEMHARWHEVEDGVLWSSRAEGVVASEIARGSAAEAAGVQRGDLLLAVNGLPVQAPSEVIEYQHRSVSGTRLTYTLVRFGT